MKYEQKESLLRQEKGRRSRKRRRTVRKLMAAGAGLLILAAVLWAFLWGPLGKKAGPAVRPGDFATPLPGETARIWLMDVGQGLGILAQSGGDYMLIDGGGGQASSRTVALLKELGVRKLKYIVLTHYDEDHMGGAIGALEAFGAETVMGPDYEKDSRSYRSLTNRLAAAGLSLTHPRPGDVFPLGMCQFTVLGPLEDYEEENDRCLVLRLSGGGHSLLVTGDAQARAEADLVLNWGRALESDMLVVGHHGSYTSSNTDFLAQVKPRYLLLSCGADNEFGHPHASAMKRLEKSGAALWRTDRQGDIGIIWTEEEIIWEQQPYGW